VERFAHLPDVTPSRAVPRVILASVIVLFGLFPGLLFDVINTATTAFFNLFTITT
jgi:NADH-quinone oxidoreductase subunit M